MFPSSLPLPIQIILVLSIIIVLMLWIVSIIWVNRDAKMREASAMLWTIIAIIPIAGVFTYYMLRPPLNTVDSTEQAMSLELMGRQLADYGNCPRCGEPVKHDFVACPHCRAQLRNVCSSCGRPLEPGWKICPYCARPHARQERKRA